MPSQYLCLLHACAYQGYLQSLLHSNPLQRCICYVLAASLSDDAVFLYQIARNYLYYDCTNYEALLQLYNGDRQQTAIRAKVEEAVEAAYPSLLEQVQTLKERVDGDRLVHYIVPDSV